MISHKHKCIFVHIPRCGGTSMEINLNGTPHRNFSRKHIIASTAKKIYEPYWDDYFKFSFVRNPWDRMVSLHKFRNFYGVVLRGGKINMQGYLKKFPEIEIDPRSVSVDDKFEPKKNTVYLNILDVELDFIGRFENIDKDFERVYQSIGEVPVSLTNDRKHQSKHKHYTEYYDDETRQIVAEKYAKDIEYFGYEFGE